MAIRAEDKRNSLGGGLKGSVRLSELVTDVRERPEQDRWLEN